MSSVPESLQHDLPNDAQELSQHDINEVFPLSSKYDKSWVLENSLGEHVLFNAESLVKALELKPGMRVLDLGCGRAASSIFFAREFGCQVWAIDKKITAEENMERVREAGLVGQVFPLQAAAERLAFPQEFFDAIVAVDSYMYYGTDQSFLPYLTQFLKRGGRIGVVDACFRKEITHEKEAPGFLRETFRKIWQRVHSLDWWKALWRKSGAVIVEHAEIIPESKAILQEFVRDYRNHPTEGEVARIVAQDTSGFISLFRLVGRRARFS